MWVFYWFWIFNKLKILFTDFIFLYARNHCRLPFVNKIEILFIVFWSSSCKIRAHLDNKPFNKNNSIKIHIDLSLISLNLSSFLVLFYCLVPRNLLELNISIQYSLLFISPIIFSECLSYWKITNRSSIYLSIISMICMIPSIVGRTYLTLFNLKRL